MLNSDKQIFSQIKISKETFFLCVVNVKNNEKKIYKNIYVHFMSNSDFDTCYKQNSNN